MGSAPPIEDVEELPFLPDVRRTSSQVYHQISEDHGVEDFKDMKKASTRPLQPLKSLKTVIDDRMRAIKDREKGKLAKPSNLSAAAKQVVTNMYLAAVCVVSVV